MDSWEPDLLTKGVLSPRQFGELPADVSLTGVDVLIGGRVDAVICGGVDMPCTQVDWSAEGRGVENGVDMFVGWRDDWFAESKITEWKNAVFSRAWQRLQIL